MRNDTRRAAYTEIDLSALASNYRAIKALSGSAKIVAAVKADAYGHGAVKCSWELIKQGVDYLGVATLNEAVELRQAGIRTPIILLGTTPRGNAKDIIDLDVIPVVTTYDDAVLLSETADNFSHVRNINILIALETGMGRIGFLNNSFDRAKIAAIDRIHNINILGFMSHFATSADRDETHALSQIDAMEQFTAELANEGISPLFMSMSNSAAIVRYPQARLSAVRPGISLYGIYPSEEISKEKLPLKPVMSVKAYIVYLKQVPAGFPVSYGSTFVTERKSIIATLPLGYADGLPRALSSSGRAIVRGRYAPIVGAITMDQCMLDVTDIPDVSEYDEVILMGSDNELAITAEEISEKVGTITYETLTRFGQRLPKIYIGGE